MFRECLGDHGATNSLQAEIATAKRHSNILETMHIIQMKPKQFVRQLSQAVCQVIERIIDTGTLIVGREGKSKGEAGAIFVTETGQQAPFNRVLVFESRRLTVQLPHGLHFLVVIEKLILKPFT